MDCQCANSDKDKVYTTKRNKLVCLKHVIKSPAVYEFLKKEPDFYSKMLLFCRDGSNQEFNREAWALFYQVIYYHQGVMEYLIKGNVMASFVELVGTSYNNIVISNGLHYFTK